MRLALASLIVLPFLATVAIADDEAAVEEIRTAWSACTAVTASPDSFWIGWRHDFMNGYGEDFEWYDGRFSDQPSVLVRTILTDGILIETVTSCYRTDGTLAFIHTQALSPNYADGGDSGPIIAREGRIYYAQNGAVIRALGQYADAEGTRLGDLDDSRYMLARGCSPVTVHVTADSIETEYFSVLGDIEGKRPDYQPELYDWCAAVTAD